MKCSSPRRIYKNLEAKFPMGLLVPCGQCIQCRLNRREEWTLRLMHELLNWDSCIFFTLTYDEINIPLLNSDHGNIIKDEYYATLKKSDLQKFFKRLRKNGNKKFKYFASGEYGEESGRPHYHVILFGIDNNKEGRKFIMENWHYCQWSQLGKKPFGEVTQQSIRYVASYIEKLIIGKQGEYAYENCEKPFIIMSKGIGKDFAIKEKERIKEDNYCSVQGNKRGVPRYYKKITGCESDASKEYFIDKERELIQELTGVFATRDELYLFGSIDDNVKAEEEIRKTGVQRDKNINSLQDVSRRKRQRKF